MGSLRGWCVDRVVLTSCARAGPRSGCSSWSMELARSVGLVRSPGDPKSMHQPGALYEVFCMSWCADLEFRGSAGKALCTEAEPPWEAFPTRPVVYLSPVRTMTDAGFEKTLLLLLLLLLLSLCCVGNFFLQKITRLSALAGCNGRASGGPAG